MKTIIFYVLLLGTLLSGCMYPCENSKRPNCVDRLPADGPCGYNYARWFYNAGTNACERYSYYGCNSYGFDKKDDCEKCQCHN